MQADSDPDAALQLFHPAVRAWFEQTHAAPTAVQAQSWPRIAAGSHVLITAPTGSGKTLTAFLVCIHRFTSGQWSGGRTRVLYISPLKALNNDIRVNLTEPLAALNRDFGVPPIRIGVRSGDTPAGERQRLLRSPPDILITTPESLHLLLTSARGRQALADVRCVIVDEIHALLDNRRGAALSVGLERLADIAGEFQRIALSATVHPLAEVARWIAGRDADGNRRPVEVINAGQAKRIELRVRYPIEVQDAAAAGQKIWEPLSREFRAIIHRNRSTLFFTNSRRLAERITLQINQDDPVAFAHHGSLARELRAVVEQRLKGGELKAIVATSSLEMGIDIGVLDEVILVQAPPSVAATLQRIGRAGHTVGATSVGTLFPSHGRDLLHAAVLATAVERRDLEPVRPMTCPLDILVQIILSVCATQPCDIDRLFELVTRSAVYESLERTWFDLVIDMLSGRFDGVRVRELKPRLVHDHARNTVVAAKGALYALYASGGSIPDRGYYKLRSESGTVIGELDEEFVWEATLGQTFTLGTQAWTIQRITHNDVLVKPARPDARSTPFWRSETRLRGAHLSGRIGDFLRDAEDRLAARDENSLRSRLAGLNFDDGGIDALTSLLERQRQVTNAPLPHRYHLLVERAAGGPDGYRGPGQIGQLILHTLWGGALNQPYALALRTALTAAGLDPPDVFADDDAVVVQCREWPESAAVLGLVTTANVDSLLRQSLEGSGLFGARFRESAQRSLLLAKPRFNQRLPLWMSRLHAKKLLTAVKRYEDFPVLLETWRTCLQDEFDLPALHLRLQELESGQCTWTETHTTAPSPFAASVRFDQISPYMYATDDPEDSGTSLLSGDLIAGAVRNPALRSPLTTAVIREFEGKRQRTAPGYAPASQTELVEWVRERIAVPRAEWEELLTLAAVPEFVHPALTWLSRGERSWLVHEDYRLILDTGMATASLRTQHLQLSVEMLSFYGPCTRQQLAALLPDMPAELLADGRMATDVRIEGESELHCCEVENLEILLRLQRARSRWSLAPRSARQWPAFMADLHDLGQAPAAHEDMGHSALVGVLERLSGYPAPVDLWLNDLVAARVGNEVAQRLGDTITTGGFVWRGAGRERIRVLPADEAHLFPVPAGPDTARTAPSAGADLLAAFSDTQARYSFVRIRDQVDLPLPEFNRQWWQAVWEGHLATDEWPVLQQASRRRFELGDGSVTGTAANALRRRPRLAPAGWPGNWYRVANPDTPSPLEALEHSRQLVRVLLDRYGVLCRELVLREGLSWASCFRALRIMELAGEVTGGLYFEGLSGPQFATRDAIRQLQHPATGRCWWINALDPVSPCGLGLDWPELPHRRATNWLAFAGVQLVMVATNGGKQLYFPQLPSRQAWPAGEQENDFPDTADPALEAALQLLRHLVNRHRRIGIEQINGIDAPASPWLPLLERAGRVHRDHRRLELE